MRVWLSIGCSEERKANRVKEAGDGEASEESPEIRSSQILACAEEPMETREKHLLITVGAIIVGAQEAKTEILGKEVLNETTGDRGGLGGVELCLTFVRARFGHDIGCCF